MGRGHRGTPPRVGCDRSLPSHRPAHPLAPGARCQRSGTQATSSGRGKQAPGGLICKSCFNYLEMISCVASNPGRLHFLPLGGKPLSGYDREQEARGTSSSRGSGLGAGMLQDGAWSQLRGLASAPPHPHPPAPASHSWLVRMRCDFCPFNTRQAKTAGPLSTQAGQACPPVGEGSQASPGPSGSGNLASTELNTPRHLRC